MRRRNPQAGLTLIEIMIASAIMVVMMSLAWRTIGNTGDVKRTYEAFEQRNHELRAALGRVVADFESAYLSANEDKNATHRRTMMIGKTSSKFPDLRFSTMGHRVLWADANESEQTVISYATRNDPESKTGAVDWIRREQRRPSNENPDDEPAEYDVLLRDVTEVKIEFWDWKDLDWQDTWDTTQTDGEKDRLPTRVRITITIKDPNGKDYKVTTQARILMQEMLVTSP